MHESALARTIVAALRDHAGWVHARIMIADPSFAHREDALRLHLDVEGLEPDVAGLEIVMVPIPAVCMRCGRTVEVVGPEDACSWCNGSVIPVASSATFALELHNPGDPLPAGRPGDAPLRLDS